MVQGVQIPPASGHFNIGLIAKVLSSDARPVLRPMTAESVCQPEHSAASPYNCRTRKSCLAQDDWRFG